MFGWIFLLFFSFSGQAQDLNSSFLEGLKAYESKDFKKANEIFRPLFEKYPNNPTLLYNLGLVQYQLGEYGLALGLWRKARFIDRNFNEALLAIQFTEEKLFPEKSEPPVYITLFNGLASLSFSFWFLTCFFSLLVGGWFSLEYGIRRRTPFLAWPTWVYFTLPLFVVSCFFALFLAASQMEKEATVIVKNLQTRANPSLESPHLAELNEGQVVKVETQIGRWVRIRTQRGALGWVPLDSVLIFKGF